MNKKKSANKNKTNYHLYHALMEALIADEDAIDKEVADKITDTREAGVDSSMHRSDPGNQNTLTILHYISSRAEKRTGKKKTAKRLRRSQLSTLPKPFTKNSVFLQNQMDEMHKLLTNKVQRCEELPLSMNQAQKPLEYLDFGLEELVPSLWVESEREYDINAVYGITHWWFRRKEFYINKHSESSDRKAFPDVTCEFSVISNLEKDFKNLKQTILKICVLLNIKKELNHSAQDNKTIFTLHQHVDKKPADYYFKEDYTIVTKPTAVVYRDRNDQRKLMRLNELHKFSDGTSTRVMEKLYQMVKDFHLYEYNKGMETRKWSEDDKE
ncbi:hypothetical protein Tco_0642443 [Tanacetum coccineum]